MTFRVALIVLPILGFFAGIIAAVIWPWLRSAPRNQVGSHVVTAEKKISVFETDAILTSVLIVGSLSGAPLRSKNLVHHVVNPGVLEATYGIAIFAAACWLGWRLVKR